MLELKEIRKTYRVGDIETKALDGVSVAFREKEFVAILGTSGSGKTTCLNIIGGLDHYDSGDLRIKGKSTKDFKDSDWDAYRNNSIGFVFQSYNLITHLSIVANVELGMTLSNVPAQERHQKALDALERVGLKEHLHKKPNQLSGGQMQRVAIARALANDPEILLCDEPTGALDSTTSVQIMDLIKEVAKDKLVIMVTHNPELAERYADRIIRFSDGKIIDDSHPHEERPKPDQFRLKKTSMKLRTALHLSFNNLYTKKGRTFLTAFASSIGIIGIAVILSLSTGFQSEIDDFQAGAMAEFPVIISQATQEVNMDEYMQESQIWQERVTGTGEYADTDSVQIVDSSATIKTHTNKLDGAFADYLGKISPDICGSIGYVRIANMNLIKKTDDGYLPVSFAGPMMSGSRGNMTSTSSMGLSCYPDSLRGESYLEKNYELLAGSYPAAETDVVLVVNTRNQLEKSLYEQFGFTLSEGQTEVPFDEIVGTTFRVIDNNDYYVTTQYGTFLPGTDYEAMYNSDKGFDIKISGIVRAKEGTTMSMLAAGIAYNDALTKRIIAAAQESEIVKAQQESDVNIMTMQEFDEGGKEQFISYLGGSATPYMVLLFPSSFEAKDEVVAYLDAYNEGKAEDDVVTYTDLAGTMSNMTSGIMDGITVVLIAFAAISLVVSMIMICIITYTSVIERTKEIGILKALGARKKDITRVFDAETMILGVFSGLLGVFIAWLCTFPINKVINDLAGLTGASHLQLAHALVLVAVSTVLTVLGGHIPARMASKKDAVEALRAE